MGATLRGTIFSNLRSSIVNETMHGFGPQRNGNGCPSNAPFDICPWRDGFVALGVGNDGLFDKFCRIIGHPELLEDERFQSNTLRCTNYIPALQNIIGTWCRGYTKREIEDIMDKGGIPCGPVLNMEEAIEHPHIQAREMMVRSTHPTAGDLYFQGEVIKLTQTPCTEFRPAPVLGQHNAEIFNLSGEQLVALKAEGVI